MQKIVVMLKQSICLSLETRHQSRMGHGMLENGDEIRQTVIRNNLLKESWHAVPIHKMPHEFPSIKKVLTRDTLEKCRSD